MEIATKETEMSSDGDGFYLQFDDSKFVWALPEGAPTENQNTKLALLIDRETIPLDHVSDVSLGNATIKVDQPSRVRTAISKVEEVIRGGIFSMKIKSEKLTGDFSLVQSSRMGGNAWYLVRDKNDADEISDVGENERQLDQDSKVEITALPKTKIPSSLKPMQPVQTRIVSEPTDWIYEEIVSGDRVSVSKAYGEIHVCKTDGTDITIRCNRFLSALKSIDADFLLDGFLQSSLDPAESQDLKLVIIDIVWSDGHDFKEAPLEFRKKYLKQIFREVPGQLEIVQSVDILKAEPEKTVPGFFSGRTIAKRKLGIYVEGSRSLDWVELDKDLTKTNQSDPPWLMSLKLVLAGGMSLQNIDGNSIVLKNESPKLDGGQEQRREVDVFPVARAPARSSFFLPIPSLKIFSDGKSLIHKANDLNVLRVTSKVRNNGSANRTVLSLRKKQLIGIWKKVQRLNKLNFQCFSKRHT